MFIAAAISTATSIVPAARAGRAMSVVISGFATASALGLPLGTLLGRWVGWRGSFVAVVLIGLLVLVAAAVLLPRVPAAAPAAADHRPATVRSAFAPRVLAVLAVGAVMFAGIQSALTYLVPFLEGTSGVTGPAVGLFLLGYGVATTAGSAVGGRFADADASRAIVVGTAGVTLSLLLLSLGGTSPVVAGLAVVGIGLSGMGIAPSIQHRVASLAGPAAAVAASLPASAVNLGIALGASAGGVAIGIAGIPAAVGTGVVLAAAAVGIAWLSRTLAPPERVSR
nr:MFS transporter [Nakamurella alba]